MKKLFISKFALLASLFVVAFTANAQVDFPVPNNQTTPTDVAPLGTSPSGDTSTDVEPSDTNPSDVMPTDVDARAVPPTPTVNVSEMCGQVDFQITNYDAALYEYYCQENGNWVRMASAIKTVDNATNGQRLTYQFKAVDGANESAVATANATFATTPQIPNITVSGVCDSELSFKLANPETGVNYLWTVNGINVTNRVVNHVYKETNPINGQLYQVQVKATNSYNTTCTSQSMISHTYVALPPKPQVRTYEECQIVGSKAWADLLTNYDATTYDLVWYNVDGVELTAHNDMFDTNVVDKQACQVAYKNRSTLCVGEKSMVTVNIGAMPVADAGLDRMACVGTALQVSTMEQTGMGYRWSCLPNAGVFSNANEAQTNLTFNRAGNYTVSVEVYNTTMNKCKATSSFQVQAVNKPTLVLEQTLRNNKDLWVCEGSATLLSVANPDITNISYTWDDPYSLLLGATMNPSVTTRELTAADNGKTVTVTASYYDADLTLCQTSKEITLVVQSKPVADASGRGVDTYNVCKNESVVLGLPNVTTYSYQWEPADGLRNGNTTIAQPNTIPLGSNASMNYRLTVTDRLTGCANTSDVTLNAVQSPSMYQVTVTNGGVYCQGSVPTNVDIKIGASDNGTQYALYKVGSVEPLTWIDGTGSALQWENQTSGSYTVKARVPKGNNMEESYCEVDLNDSPILVQEKPMAQVSLQRANESERLCPNLPVTMQLLFTQGVSPYEVILDYYDAQDVLIDTQVIPDIVRSPYTFTYTPQGYTKIKVTQVSDSQGCVRNYQPDDAPTVEINIPNADDFVITPSTRLSVCPGEIVVLSTNYDPAVYPDVDVSWSLGSDYDNMGTVSIEANETATYTMTVRMPEMGCEFTNSYTIEVKERLNPEILDLADKYCANPNVQEPLISLSAGSATGGEWSCLELPALMQGGNINLDAVTQTGTYTIQYKIKNGGCEEVVTKSTYIYNMVPVTFDVAPVIMPIDPNSVSNQLQYCVPAGNNKNVTLQGYPLTEDGTWELISYVGTGATAATLVPIGDPGESMAQLKNLASQGTYKVRYTVKDNAGCDSYAEKDVFINGEFNVQPTAGGYNLENEAGRLAPQLANGPTICYNDAEATIYANVPQNIKSAQFSTPAINPLSNVNDQPGAANGRWTIYPNNAASAQARGAQSVVFTYETSQGCPFKERFDFYINEGVTIHPFELEDSYCTGDPDVPLHVQSQGATKGYITIERIDEAGNVLETVVNSQVASTPAVFSPRSFAPGKYCITYKYSDDNDVCTDEHKQYTYLHAPADIVFDFPKDHCRGAEVKLNTIPQTAAIELVSNTPADALVNQTFYTDRAGLGKHTIRCTVIDDNVCTAVEEMDIMVHGAKTEDMTINGVAAQYCAPQGLVDVEAFPNVPGFGTFAGCEHLSPFIYPVLDAAGNPVSGKATIDLSKGNYNQEYTIYYTYKTDYVTDATTGAALSCETTISKDFEILSEFVEFTGFSDGDVLCGNKESILLESNKKGSSQASNVTFTFSNPSIANAFVNHGDGTATLYPAKLPEGGYHVKAEYNYMVPGNPTPVCTSSVLKHFRIAKIDQVNDIYFSCQTPDALTVCLQSTEDHVRYELFINGYSVQQKVGTGSSMCFDVPLGDADYIEAVVTGTDVDNNYCVVEMTKTIQINQLKLDLQHTPISCFGKHDGTITAQITGGKAAYILQNLTNQQTGEVKAGVFFDGLEAGKYTYLVQDQNGCEVSDEVEIVEPTELAVNFSHQSALCSSQASGEARADVVVGTGTPGYTFSWYSAADPTVELGTDMSIGGLGGVGNNYTYKGKVTDARGCSKDYTFTINAPSLLTLEEVVTSHQDVAIVGEASGKIEVKADGGVTPYTYTWSGGLLSPAVTTTDYIHENLKADTYYINVKDANGCEAPQLTVKVTEPTPFDVKSTVTHVSCHGGNNGMIDLDITGGVAPYIKTEWTKEGQVVGSRIDLIGVSAGDYVFHLEDSQGNTYSQTFRINDADPFAIEVSLTSKTALTCYGNTDGNIDIALLGGHAPFQVEWEGIPDAANQLSADKLHAFGLAKGQYKVKVTDNNGCEAKLQDPIEITQPDAPLTLNMVVEQNACHNDQTGNITLQPTGGTSSYTYEWTGTGIDMTRYNQQNQTDLEPGYYQVTVTDATGQCEVTQGITLENPNPLAVRIEPTHIVCHGRKGEAKAVVTQTGRGNLVYQWTDATGTVIGNSNEISMLDEGEYTLTVTDNNGNGCTQQQTVEITQNNPIVLQIESGNIDCYDNQNGWAKVNVTGGSGQFNYSWELIGGGVISTADQVTHLDAKSYRVTVSEQADATCYQVAEVSISQPQEPLSITYDVQHVKIHGQATGAIVVKPQGGTPTALGEYSYEWLDGPNGFTPAERTSGTITNRLAGQYLVRVTDANGCSQEAIIEITQPQTIQVNATVKNVTCNGQNNGAVLIDANGITGGNGNYSCLWSWTDASGNPQTRMSVPGDPLTYSLLDVEAGNYDLLVTDTDNNTYQFTYVITQAEALSITTVLDRSKLLLNCNGDADGAIYVAIQGGATPYQSVVWSTAQQPAQYNYVENLTAGTYNVTVIDANGCSLTHSVDIEQPEYPMALTYTVTQNKCYGDTKGEIEVAVTGGNGNQPSDYTYHWSGGVGLKPGTDRYIQDELPNNETYLVRVADSKGCEISQVFDKLLVEPNPLSIDIKTQNVDCNGNLTGWAEATILSPGSGNYNYYKWENADGSYQVTNLKAEHLKAGEYTFSIEDVNGCLVQQTVTIEQPAPLTVTLDAPDVLCNGINEAEIYALVQGGTQNYTYQWELDNVPMPEAAGKSFLKDQGKGTYRVTITDANQCTIQDEHIVRWSDKMSFTKIDVTHVEVHGEATGVIDVEVQGGTTPPDLQYSWATIGGSFYDPTNSPDQHNLTAGVYTLLVTDVLGCELTTTQEVKQPEHMRVDYQLQDIVCPGDKGAVSITAEGGYQPYYVTITGANGVVAQGENVFEVDNLEAGFYTILVQDAKSNLTERNFSVSPVLDLKRQFHQSFTNTQIKCHGGATGKAMVEVTGGTAPYHVVWSGDGINGLDSKQVEYLKAGVYTATITDARGCEADHISLEITQPDAPLLLEAAITENTCYGAASGAIDITVSGGTPFAADPLYSYRWSGMSAVLDAQDQENLRAGEYKVEVKDANDCIVSQQFELREPMQLHATLSGNGIVCEGDEMAMQLNVEGVAPWKVIYTDGTQLYDIDVTERMSTITHTPTQSCTYKLIKVVDNDGMGCDIEVSGEVPVEVHMVPELTILDAETECCYGESVKVDMVMANEGGWSVTYTDGIQRFTNAHDYLVITPTQTGTKTYTISRIANAYCAKELDYQFDVTTYQIPQLTVQLPTEKVCEPDAIEIGLETEGSLPMLLKYTLNGTPFEKEINAANEAIVVDETSYKDVNNFMFETITSGQKCQATINQTYTIEVGMLPEAAKYINGRANICHETRESFVTAPLENAATYHWTVPEGFSIVSGLGGTSIEVVAGPDAQNGEITVCGVNQCGRKGKAVSFPVYLDSPIATNGRIDFGATYYCLDGKFITATVTDVEGATSYKWLLPTGFTDVSSAGNTVKQSILIEMDELARTTQISVTPTNHCTTGNPITATVTVRKNPVAEAGTDIYKPCKATSVVMGAKPVVGVGPSPDQNWQMVDGDGNIIDQKDPKSEVDQLLYGANTLLWVINDGYCTGWDTVRVFNRTPVLTYPEAEEVTICEDFMTLRAPEPAFDKGRWKLIGGDGEILDPDNNVTEIVGLSTTGVNEVRWEVYNEFCSESTSMFITSNSLHELADAGEDGVTTNGAFRLSAQNFNNPQVTGTWSVVSGSGEFADPNSPSTIVTGLAQGINTLRWTLTGYDCEAYDEIQIRSADEPVAGFNMSENRGCEPFTVQFDNITIGQAEYTWDFGDGRYSTLRSPEHTFDKAGVYTIKLTAKGKYKTDVTEKQIEVLPSPKAAFSVQSTQVYVPDAEVSFHCENIDMQSYYWDFGDGHFSTQKDPFYTYTENGEYDITLIVTDLNGCADTLTYEKYIRVGEGAFIVFPTAFTPNVTQMLDGKYKTEERRLDIFYPVWKNVETIQLEIFNQWGNLVFSTNELDQGWNGYFLGQPAAQGTYVYKAEGRYQDGTSFRVGGSVLLIR
ncbi:MAG: PKD domain-containing protein [Paludibacteraceae bacterium]|nr:PKD domain-containing protein [Paludibacteraceae bacterium]